MTCPKNASGQSLCHIVPHPDRDQESFCTTCNRRFISQESNSAGSSSSHDQSPGFWPLLAGVCAVVFILAMISNDSPSDDQPQNTANPITSQTSLVQTSLAWA